MEVLVQHFRLYTKFQTHTETHKNIHTTFSLSFTGVIFFKEKKGTRTKRKKRKSSHFKATEIMHSNSGMKKYKFTHLQINKDASPFHTTTPILLTSRVESTPEGLRAAIDSNTSTLKEKADNNTEI